MPFLIDYLMKLSISLGVVYVFYQLLLRRLTFYNWNRFYLVGYTLLCFFIPFINITPILEQNQLSGTNVITFLPTVQAYTTSIEEATICPAPIGNTTLTKWDILLFILGAGFVFALTKFFIRLSSFLRIRSKSTLISNGTMRIYQVNQRIIPFSFGQSIFINRSLHTEGELEDIIRHEFVHVRQRHTIDIIWSEVLCMICWYNPFAWLIRHSIRQNLEFIADNKVVQAGIDPRQYQYLLLKVIGNNHFSIANNFNFSSLKKRIAMMNKIKSGKVHVTRFLFLLPLLAVLLLSFRNVKFSNAPESQPTVKYEGLAFDIESKKPVQGVRVMDQQTGLETTTDENGYFRFELPVRTTRVEAKLNLTREGYISQVASFEVNFATTPTSKGMVELIGMKKGKTTEKCEGCLSTMSVEFEGDTTWIGYNAARELYERYLDSNKPDPAAESPYSEWKLTGVGFSCSDSVTLDSEKVLHLSGDIKFTVDQQSKGLVIFEGKEYGIKDFAGQFGERTFERASIYEKSGAHKHFGQKGKNGVIVINPGNMTSRYSIDTLPAPSDNPIHPSQLPGARSEATSADILNNKGYYVRIIDNKGNCTVSVRDRDFVEVARVLLTEWDVRKKWYEENYGSIPPLANASSRVITNKENMLSNLVIIADSLFWDSGTKNLRLIGNAKIEDKKNASALQSDVIEIHQTVPVIYLNGNELEFKKYYKAVKGNMYTLHTLEREAAIKKYGDKGSKGIVEIKSL